MVAIQRCSGRVRCVVTFIVFILLFFISKHCTDAAPDVIHFNADLDDDVIEGDAQDFNPYDMSVNRGAEESFIELL